MEAVLFDFGGTLDSDGVAWKDRFYPFYKECGATVEPAKFDRAFYDADDNLPIRHNLHGLGLEETVTLQIGDTFANLRISDSAAERAVREKFLSASRAAFRRNKPFLARLKARARLGVVSNFYGNLVSVLESEGLLEYFDAVADSRVVGAEKPSPAIFNHALEKLRVKPAAALMVGDSVKRDIAGAEAAGLSAALLWGERYAEAAPPELRAGTLVLKTLPELEGKLSGVPVKNYA